MKIKKINDIFILSALFSLFFLKTGLAVNDYEVSVFSRANVYYEQANYDEAVKQYNSILKSGKESGNLYYNLGNCYFKKRELGKAILNYEKARKLIPLDKDLESNYEYARSLANDQVVGCQKSPLLKISDNLFEKLTIDGLTILLSMLYILILTGILMSFFFRSSKKYILIFSVFTGLFFMVSLIGLKGKIALLNKEGIVIVKRIDAKFEPMNKATTYFTLYEGMKVEIISSKDNWYKVRRQDNKSGWIENSSVEVF